MFKILFLFLFSLSIFANDPIFADTQVFTAPESAILKQAQANLFQTDGATEAQLNRTKSEQKTFFVAQLDAQLTPLQSAIDNIDAAVAAIKIQKLAELNAQKSLLESLKTKIQNLPE